MRKAMLIAIFLVFVLSSCVFGEEINIGVAANFQQCINKIIEVYNIYNIDKPIKINCVYGSSGKLFAQIKNSAPIDIFFSANTEYPEKLFKENLTIGPPKIYAKGKFVLWSKNKRDLSRGLRIILDDDIQKISIADPKIAPYGAQTVRVLKSQGIWDLIQNKIVYGSNVGQVNHFITSGAVDIGITSLSSVIMLDEYKDQWILIPDGLYQPIAQAAVIIKKDVISKEVNDFYEFIFSEKAAAIIEKYGYEVK